MFDVFTTIWHFLGSLFYLFKTAVKWFVPAVISVWGVITSVTASDLIAVLALGLSIYVIHAFLAVLRLSKGDKD